MARIDYAPGGLNPPHTHPRATEIVFVLEGELDVGFMTIENKLFSKTIMKGEIFTFPRGLIHFQINNGNVSATIIAAFNNQFPGTQRVVTAMFASSPTIEDVVLTKTFQVGTKEEKKVKSRLAPKNMSSSPSSFSSTIRPMRYSSLIIHYFFIFLNTLYVINF
ncbi:hypothetical protein M8C21_020284 [Ambrosia artemisiifolia]|uniref:Germin-like protein n=1 Tax=Ambrosia artemisiifolia TaxID=4212 RepID=A0AAD5CDL3_AMBAR|nr:hypothetical protein M8C21_020284 [Ambrosia artemisiifolia]